MFLHLSVILFTGGVSQHAMGRWCLPLGLGGVYHPVQTPPVGRRHPRQIPTVGRLSPVEMTIEAGGTHPTGMHSFLLLIRCEEKFFLSMEWNSIKLSGSAHEIVTKTIHMCILHWLIFTVRQWSCGKVMFSHLLVCYSAQWGGHMWPLPMMHWRSLYSPLAPGLPLFRHGTWDHPVGDVWWPCLVTCSNLYTWGPPPTILTFGDHQSTYRRQAGGTHHFGMLSCLFFDLQLFISHTEQDVLGFDISKEIISYK